jgi:hypothetical protein
MMHEIAPSINDTATRPDRQPLLAVAKAPVPPVYCTIKTGEECGGLVTLRASLRTGAV